LNLIGGVWHISSGIGPRFPLARGLCKLYANAGGKWQIQRPPFLAKYQQQANPLLSMHNYTPLVITDNFYQTSYFREKIYLNKTT
jgi:hypothetical protein